MMKRTICAAAPLLLAAMLAVVPATEVKPRKPQKPALLTLEVAFPNSATGKIKTATQCQANRRVVLIELPSEGQASRVGRTTTENNGDYSFDDVVINPMAEYQTLSPRVVKKRVVCRSGSSGLERVESGPDLG